jgi:hypothetical protein
MAGRAGASVSIPLELLAPSLVALYLLLALLGFLFWFGFFAAIAATINAPNNSSRSAFPFFPVLPFGLAFAALEAPDAPVLRARPLPGDVSGGAPGSRSATSRRGRSRRQSPCSRSRPSGRGARPGLRARDPVVRQGALVVGELVLDPPLGAGQNRRRQVRSHAVRAARHTLAAALRLAIDRAVYGPHE